MVLAGCTQQDTECLARMGRKFLDRSQAAADSLRGQVEGDLKGVPRPPVTLGPDASLKEKVEARLRFDALLADAKIEVQVTGSSVELKGTVKNEAQRRQAGDIVSTTVGVKTVDDALKVEE
jgi:osmotically-inducible protein OsmY